eukprot:CCRYP_001878-RB/>CCRYP_001878-RB protein AED:0.21 eAED:0.21 QI:1385/0.8/1/1/0.6/0.5/6/212/266
MKYSVNKRKRRIWRVGQILAVGHLQLKSGMSATLSAPFTGPYHADGTLFTLETKSTQLSIRGFDINLDAGATTVEVYSRPGVIVTNNNDNGWFLVQTAQINGQGKGLATSLPDFTFPVSIPANSKQSFYVTSSDGAKDVWYDLGQNLGQPYAADEYLSVLEGYALAYSFVASSGPRRWNVANREANSKTYACIDYTSIAKGMSISHRIPHIECDDYKRANLQSNNMANIETEYNTEADGNPTRFRTENRHKRTNAKSFGVRTIVTI